MDRKALRTLLREELDDTASSGNLWSDTLLNAYLAEADLEACRRSRINIESEDSELCKLVIKSGRSYTDLSPRVIGVRSIRIDGTPLVKMTADELDQQLPGWRTTGGSVNYWCPDVQRGKIYWASLPQEDDFAMATVVAEPEEMSKEEDEPSVPVRSQYKLLHWAKFRAYGKRDADTFNPKSRDEELALFTAEFGPAINLVEEDWINTNQGFYDDGAR